ncbi:hypothetical protein HZR84_00070 [Hyphobacterium sp. CCMP332]|nr:hypothetical protein HZR84_00070 [Hyphobacterium sp. CCMP332]
MSKKLLIDLLKLRDLERVSFEAADPALLKGEIGFKSIRELATFRFTCRRCMDAPCIDSCPVDALQRDEEHVIHRKLNLCIRCKSCIAMCPFGTMPLDLFQVKPDHEIYDISNKEEMKRFADNFPDEMVTLTEEEEDWEKHIYALGDHVLIKDYAWHELP